MHMSLRVDVNILCDVSALFSCLKLTQGLSWLTSIDSRLELADVDLLTQNS